MDKRIVEQVLKKSLNHQEGESVLIVTDTLKEGLAREFHDALLKLDVDCTLISMPPRQNHGEEPPAAVAAAMKTSPIAILLTTMSLTHTQARRDACDKHRVRVASMPGVDPDRLERLLGIDYDDHAKRCEDLGKLLDGTHIVRVTSAIGTDLTFKIGGRTVYRDHGKIHAPGSFGNLPCGEVCLAPIEGSANGKAVVDGSIAGLGLLEAPVSVAFKDGVATEISDPRLKSLLTRHGDDAFSLAEFGVGTNPRAQVVGNVIEDEKACGTVHVALGANASMGGKVQVPVHLDMIMLRTAVAVDGAELPERFLTGQMQTKKPKIDVPAFDLDAEKAYREFFDHSNDAQYVLDLATQRFIEVNASFEKLTGYSREEAISGAVTAPKLVARESMSTFTLKSQNWKLNPSERYDLKLIGKDGEKKAVELSVRRVQINKRDVVIGSIRDLTARKKLETEMWEKIEDLGFANNRILALTEKIRRVPELATKLFNISEEKDLLEKTAEGLCAREGLAYAEVTFYVGRDNGLDLAYSTDAKRKTGKVDPADRPSRLLRGEDKGEMTKAGALLPLKGPEGPIGVIEVKFHPKEIEVLEGNERALKGYQDLLATLSDIIGLRLNNLHLYEKVRLQSIVDQVTGVYNRRWFDSKIVDEIHRSARYGRALSLMMIDLDHFKEVNDTFGHGMGDIVLVESAKIFKHHTREVDTVCRLGGDEFAILMPETTYEAALAKAEQLRREVKARDYGSNPSKPVNVSLSIGVTAYTKDISGPDELVKQADEALYAAKRAGRNTYMGYLTRPKGAKEEAKGGKDKGAKEKGGKSN